MFTGWERPSHWLVIAIVVLVLFGYKKLPDAARSVGRSLRIFKTEIKGMTEDDKARDSAREKAGEGAPSEVAKAVTIPTSQQAQIDAAAASARPRPKPNVTT